MSRTIFVEAVMEDNVVSKTATWNIKDFKITIRGFDITKDVHDLSIEMKPEGSLQISLTLISNDVIIKPGEILIYDKEKEVQNER